MPCDTEKSWLPLQVNNSVRNSSSSAEFEKFLARRFQVSRLCKKNSSKAIQLILFSDKIKKAEAAIEWILGKLSEVPRTRHQADLKWTRPMENIVSREKNILKTIKSFDGMLEMQIYIYKCYLWYDKVMPSVRELVSWCYAENIN